MTTYSQDWFSYKVQQQFHLLNCVCVPYSNRCTTVTGGLAVNPSNQQGTIGPNKRKRTLFSSSQRKVLEKEFRERQYVELHDREVLSQMTGIPEDRILTWFQNRRAKWRRDNKCWWTYANNPYSGFSGVTPPTKTVTGRNDTAKNVAKLAQE